MVDVAIIAICRSANLERDSFVITVDEFGDPLLQFYKSQEFRSILDDQCQYRISFYPYSRKSTANWIPTANDVANRTVIYTGELTTTANAHNFGINSRVGPQLGVNGVYWVTFSLINNKLEETGSGGGAGATGPTGPQGDTGPTGVDGRTILNGTVAPTSGDGIIGDFWIDTTLNQLWGPKDVTGWNAFVSLVGPAGPVGATGTSGATGAPGADGAPGKDGRTVLNGASAPSSGDGDVGDFWIDTSLNQLWGPKDVTGWNTFVSLVGPAGANGADGAVGPTGPAGPSGTGGLQAGQVTVSIPTSNFDLYAEQPVTFNTAFASVPNVVASVQDPEVGVAPRVQVKNVTAAGFDVRLSEYNRANVTVLQELTGSRNNSLAIIAGHPAVAFESSVNPGVLSYVRALDPEGKRWGPVIVLNSGGPIQRAGIKLATVNGFPGVVFARGGTAPTFIRANDATGSAWGTAIQIDTGSNNSIDLEIVDGNPAICYGKGVNVIYRRSDNTDGSTWGSPVTIPTNATGFNVPFVNMGIVDGRPAITYAEQSGTYYLRAGDALGSSWPASQNTGINGVQRPKLAVVNGLPAVTNGQLDSINYARSQNVDGTAWDSATVIVNADRAGINNDLKVINGKPLVVYGKENVANSLCYRYATSINGAPFQPEVQINTGTLQTGNIALAEVQGAPAVVYLEVTPPSDDRTVFRVLKALTAQVNWLANLPTP